jgi:aminoglycoside phosphotransferase (APT) family kinase protein
MQSPRLVGTDGDADLLSYIPGASGADGWAPAATEEGLAAAARLLRSYHDAVRDWRPDSEPVWFDGSVGTGGPEQVVCHGDFGPWNIVWSGREPVGLLDYEYARPGDPLTDVAYACEYFVPFRDDAECLRWLRYPEPPDRRRRLLIFAESYGLSSADDLVDRVIAVQSDMRVLVARLADEGFRRQGELVVGGYLDELQVRIDWSLRHRYLIDP